MSGLLLPHLVSLSRYRHTFSALRLKTDPRPSALKGRAFSLDPGCPLRSRPLICSISTRQRSSLNYYDCVIVILQSHRASEPSCSDATFLFFGVLSHSNLENALLFSRGTAAAFLDILSLFHLLLSFSLSTCGATGRWECEQNACLMEPDLIRAVNRGNYG